MYAFPNLFGCLQLHSVLPKGFLLLNMKQQQEIDTQSVCAEYEDGFRSLWSRILG